ncbi:hypothetical protein OUZ56_021007 [Daphnia magna]|uniref:Uncharacterized protein n=1 Tax=Daphnia magna TaxID=35525 RepID=A0ABQ9ZG40_9CRUS|nr:hypothetical protein OUZ56_021007 [Daphnia magna]
MTCSIDTGGNDQKECCECVWECTRCGRMQRQEFFIAAPLRSLASLLAPPTASCCILQESELSTTWCCKIYTLQYKP